jgi:5-methylcytosine-specific restriction endonuclease McrA
MAALIPEARRARVRAAAANRCGYCLTQQSYVPWTLEIEHIVPRAKGGTDDETNLWLACRACNLFKSQSL